MHGSPSHERADHEAAASAASAGTPAACSARTSSAIRPWSMPPPASVPANTGTPASNAARTTAPEEAYSRRIVLAYVGNLPSPPPRSRGSSRR
jgi:hypothetical protein